MTKVLVADSSGKINVLQKYLLGCHLSVLWANSGQQALELSLDNEFICILISSSMPDMSGMELAGLIHGDETRRHIPIVLLSSFEDWDQQMYRWHEVGIVDCIIYPIREGVVRSKMQFFLELHKFHNKNKKQSLLLEQSNADLYALASAAAHDLRAPLRTIEGFLKLIEESDTDSPEENQQYFQFIHDGVHRMNRLINAMLNYAKVDNETPTFEVIDLNKCFSEVISNIQSDIDNTNTQITINNLPIISGNNTQLHRLFQNIISNSIKYTKKDKTPVISITSQINDLNVDISISDNGIGFDMQHQNKVFQPFCRLVPHSHSEGSGIGLATALKIARLHGGEITVDSTLGVGSTFHVILPISIMEICEYRKSTSDAF